MSVPTQSKASPVIKPNKTRSTRRGSVTSGENNGKDNQAKGKGTTKGHKSAKGPKALEIAADDPEFSLYQPPNERPSTRKDPYQIWIIESNWYSGGWQNKKTTNGPEKHETKGQTPRGRERDTSGSSNQPPRYQRPIGSPAKRRIHKREREQAKKTRLGNKCDTASLLDPSLFLTTFYRIIGTSPPALHLETPNKPQNILRTTPENMATH